MDNFVSHFELNGENRDSFSEKKNHSKMIKIHTKKDYIETPIMSEESSSTEFDVILEFLSKLAETQNKTKHILLSNWSMNDTFKINNNDKEEINELKGQLRELSKIN